MRPDLALDLQDLTYGEHLIVWAFRAFTKGRACALARQEFAYGCGDQAQDAYDAMQAFVRRLLLQTRRAIVPAPPGCPTVTRDEQVLLQLFAAAQAGDSERFAAYFRRLAASAQDPVLDPLVILVAQALAAQGHRLRTADLGDIDQTLITPALGAIGGLALRQAGLANIAR